MVIEYQETLLDKCVKKVFESGAQTVGFDGVSSSPQQRGLNKVSDYITDHTLSAIFLGLGVDADSEDAKKILSAYVSGIQQINSADFPSAMNQGKPRKLTW